MTATKFHTAIVSGVLLPAMLSTAALTGCSDGRPKRAPVSGQVLIDGAPLTTGFVQLIPDNARPAWAKIGPDGRFTFQTFGNNDGAVLGTHRLVVQACERISSTKVKWHAPKKYTDPGTSELTAAIGQTNEPLVIKLTWDGGEPFIENTAAEVDDPVGR